MENLKAFRTAKGRIRGEIQTHIEQNWAGFEAIRKTANREPCFFEDVAFARGGLRLDRALLDEVKADLWSFGTLSSLFQPAYRLRTRIADLVSEIHGGEAPVLDVFKTYEEHNQSEAPPGRFEEELDRTRAAVRSAVSSCVSAADTGRIVVDWRAVEAKLYQLPSWVEFPPSMGFFLQRERLPSKPWVVNLCVDGVGRFYSRFLHLLPELQLAAASCQHSSSLLPSEIVDLGAVFSSNVNLHVPLTRRAINYPGHTHATEWATVQLRDLIVHIDDNGAPCLTIGKAGERICPVHFGFLVYTWLPRLAKFLACFGPIGPKPLPWHEDIFPTGRSRQHIPRLYWGNVLLYRERWNLFPHELAPLVRGTALDAFALVGRLQRERGLPRRGFATVDRMHRPQRGRKTPASKPSRPSRPKTRGKSHRGDNLGRKPHFLDLTSPLFLRRFCRLAAMVQACMSIEEVYPRLDYTLAVSDRHQHAVELFTEIGGPG